MVRMGNTPDSTRLRYYLYDTLRANADQAATMCALYTDSGLYDLAKERAAQWRRWDREAREELFRLTDETLLSNRDLPAG